MKPKIRFWLLLIFGQVFLRNRKEEILEYVMNFSDFAGLKGDYLEFGVWKGGSLSAAYNIAQRLPGLKNMLFYAFDSFEGLPPKTGVDSESNEFAAGEYACSLDKVKSNLKASNVNLDKIVFVKGWYQDTLNEKTRQSLSLKTAAVVYVDCDLYESAKLVLDFITPYVTDGTILIFDDWYCFKGHPDRGEQKAFREWLIKNNQWQATPYRQFGWMGNSFIINIK